MPDLSYRQGLEKYLVGYQPGSSIHLSCGYLVVCGNITNKEGQGQARYLVCFCFQGKHGPPGRRLSLRMVRVIEVVEVLKGVEVAGEVKVAGEFEVVRVVEVVEVVRVVEVIGKVRVVEVVGVVGWLR